MTDIMGRGDARDLRRPAVCAGCLAIDGFDGTFGVAGAIGVRPGADGA